MPEKRVADPSREAGGAGRVEQAAGTRKAEWHPPEDWFTTDDTPAVIDADLWDACQRRLARNGADPNAPRGRDGRARGRAPSTPTTEPGAFLLSGVLVCGHCGGPMVGYRTPKRCRPGLVYVCQQYQMYGTAACVRVQAEEGWAARRIIAELREGLLLPERLEWLTERMEEKTREQRADKTLARLRKAVAALEGRLGRERQRMMEVSRDMVPEAEVAIRKTRSELDAARKALHDAETADPVRELA